MRYARRHLPVYVVAMLLAGCVTGNVATTPSLGAAPDPARISEWTAKGRIAVAAQGEGGSGSFVWQQHDDRTELAVRGPLGAGGLDLVTDGTTLQVADASGRTLDGDAARALLEQRLGTSLPLQQLRYWMLGLPAPTTASTPADPGSASPSGFTQAGWTVNLDESRTVDGWRVPARLSAATSTVRVRIIVDDWQLSAAP